MGLDEEDEEDCAFVTFLPSCSVVELDVEAVEGVDEDLQAEREGNEGIFGTERYSFL